MVLGSLMLANPFQGAAALTLALSAVFFLSGGLRLFYAAQFRRAKVPGSGLQLFSGLLSLLIAGLIALGWPTTAWWFIGVLVGVELLVVGASLIGLGIAAQRAANS